MAARQRRPEGVARATYDLWFDESGTFRETSTRAAERAQAAAQSFPSQLAGLLVPHGALDQGSAEVVLGEAHAAAGIPLGEQVHGSGIPPRTFQLLIARLVGEVCRRGWQPVRLVNREGVSYGTRASTYTRMVAELLVRVLTELSTRGEERIDIHVIGARVVTSEHADGTVDFLPDAEYIDRIQEALSFVAVRRGLAAESAGWRVASFQLASGRRRRELQICDLVSNASHSAYKRLDPDVRKALEEAFGVFDQSLVVRELFEQVDVLVDDLSLGRALMLLAEASLDPRQAAVDGTRRRMATAVARLAGLGGRARDPELGLLVSWLEQTIDLQRSLDRGRRLASFLLSEVEAPLRERLGAAHGASLDWFTYALHRSALAACNHLGDLAGARVAAAALDRLTPALAKQWEHAPLLMRGLIHEAVHRVDCFAYDDASARAKIVADYHGELSGLFAAVMPDVFPVDVRSQVRGEALGTRLQAEMYASLGDPGRLRLARSLSDEAIAEFSGEDDRRRQWQYRCQLETIAGDVVSARSFLAQSLGVTTATHEAIGRAIADTVYPVAQGFSLLHWLRLGRGSLAPKAGDRDDFLAALRSSRTLENGWCVGHFADYPAHGILRQAAFIHAALDAPREALACLAHLQRVCVTTMHATVAVAATVEVAALLWEKHCTVASQLLHGKDRKRPGARLLLDALGREVRDGVPELWAVLEPWSVAIDGVRTSGSGSSDARDALLACARVVPY